MNAAPRPLLSVVLHDVAPSTWPACMRVMAAIREVAQVPLTLLAVPRYHLRASDWAFEQLLGDRVRQGDELALHGYSHLDEGPAPRDWREYAMRHWYTDGEGEFAALSESAAQFKMLAGIRWFQRHRWPLQGFVAPAWLLSPGAWKALKKLPFTYTATLSSVYHLPDAEPVPSPALVYSTRSAWRRLASLPRNAWVASHTEQQPLLRFELHPHDADHPMIRRSWMKHLEHHLAHREAVTMSQAMARLRSLQLLHKAMSQSMEISTTIPRTQGAVHRVVVPFEMDELSTQKTEQGGR